ncbi:MAG: hypothetical protein AAF725_07460 [Acidobacteriota bacterium]
MMMKLHSTLLAALTLSAGLLVSPALALVPTDAAVTDSGQIQRAVAGSYGELFPEGTSSPPEVRALALDLQDGAETRRLLVPTTAGTDSAWRPERSPSVVWDSTSETTILLWLSGTGVEGHDTIEFTSLQGDTWSEVRNASFGNGGDLVIFDSEPSLFVSSDSMTFATVEGDDFAVSRNVVHVVWRENATDRLLYMPLVFLNGRYTGSSEVITLSDVLSSSHEADESIVPDASASESLRAIRGMRETEDGLLMAVTDPQHGRLGVLAVELLPMELSVLADGVLEGILGFEGELAGEEALEFLGGQIRAQIISIGTTIRLNPAITEYTATRVSDWLRLSGAGLSRDQLAHGARTHALDISSSVTAQTVPDLTHDDGSITELDLSEFLSSADSDGQLADLVNLGIRLDIEAPELPAAPTPISAMLGSDGGSILLSWPVDEGQGIRYTLRGYRDGWSEPATLTLSEQLPIELAHELLRRRLP